MARVGTTAFCIRIYTLGHIIIIIIIIIIIV